MKKPCGQLAKAIAARLEHEPDLWVVYDVPGGLHHRNEAMLRWLDSRSATVSIADAQALLHLDDLRKASHANKAAICGKMTEVTLRVRQHGHYVPLHFAGRAIQCSGVGCGAKHGCFVIICCASHS